MSDDDEFPLWHHRILRDLHLSTEKIGVAVWNRAHPGVFLESTDGKFREMSFGSFMSLRDYHDGK